jgi:DNA-binding MarR family transcriptional regulator
MNFEASSSQTGGGGAAQPDPDAAEIAAIAHGLDLWSNSLGRQFGPLSRPQRRMLSLLNVETATRVGDLSEQSGLTTAGTTRMLDKLESFGYAVRSRVADSDQRQVYVTLTVAGEQALHEAEKILFDRVRSSLRVLNATERVALIHLLQRLSTQDETS